MKYILMMMMGVGLALGAQAQPKLAKGSNLVSTKPAKVIVVRPYNNFPYRMGFNPFFSPFYGYGYGSSLYAPYAYQRQPSKLDLQIEEITNDYRHEIADARGDKSVSKAERKKRIRDLRHERENMIIAAKKSYYNQRDRS